MKRLPKRAITASELLAQLQRDPEFVQKSRERDSQLEERKIRLMAEERPILLELSAIGIHIDSVWELVNTSARYAAAIPILAKHLRLPYAPVIREGLARALTVKEALGAAGRAIIDELKAQDESAPQLRFALANALSEAADGGLIEEIQELAVDPRYKDIHDILRYSLAKVTKNAQENVQKRRA